MKAAIYVRVSTPGQAVNGESLAMQKERLTAYVKAQGWELYKVYEDKGYSGKNTERPAFQQMMQDVEMGLFDVLVVYKIDRLSRSILDFHSTIEKLKKHDISFVSITQQFDTTTSTGRLMLAILVDFANFEREMDADRSIDAFRQRRAKGLTSGAIPYGYKRIEGNKVIIVKDEAEMVKRLFNLALQNYSMNEISRMTGFTKYHVRSILTNPFYCGYLVQRRDKHNRRVPENKWEWFKGQHEPIISVDLYKKVAVNRKSRAKVVKTQYARLFSKLLYCPYCKHNLTFHTKHRKGKVSFYYLCESNHPGGPGCSQYVNEQYFEEELLKRIDKFTFIKVTAKEKKDFTEDKIKKIDAKINKLVVLAERTENVQEVARRINELKKTRKELLKSKPKEKVANIKEIKKYIKNIKKVYPLMNRDEKAYFWHLIIKKVVAYKDRFLVEFNGFGSIEIPRKKKPFSPSNDKSGIGYGGGESAQPLHLIHSLAVLWPSNRF